MNNSVRHPVAEMLRRRGFEVILSNPTAYLFFPPDLDEAFEEEIYTLLKKYSFRIFVREVIKNRRSFRADDLIKYSTIEWAERYLAFLLEKGVVEALGQGEFRLRTEAAFSFGDTLEWFVARVFEREFASPALWGVRARNVSSGGDYDVIAGVEGKLVYVEVKSSPPKNIEEAEVAAFLARTEALKPSLAVFLEDTELRMKDKLVPLFENLLKGRTIRRVREETFSIDDKMFITNSDPGIVANLALCLKTHLTPGSFW